MPPRVHRTVRGVLVLLPSTPPRGVGILLRGSLLAQPRVSAGPRGVGSLLPLSLRGVGAILSASLRAVGASWPRLPRGVGILLRGSLRGMAICMQEGP